MQRTPLVVGNWKMHGDPQSVATLLDNICVQADRFEKVKVAVCPPFPFLAQAQNILTGTSVRLGAQDVSAFGNGAYTGQISASMLKAFDCQYVIVGHSERRALNQESSEEVVRKFAAAKQAGLVPILCVGETQQAREAGKTQEVIAEQLAPFMQLPEALREHAVIAYEPVWAIGTGLSATPEQAQEVHAFIRKNLNDDLLLILYGGSVKRDNAKSLFAMPDVDGGLIGGASLDAEAFVDICLSTG